MKQSLTRAYRIVTVSKILLARHHQGRHLSHFHLLNYLTSCLPSDTSSLYKVEAAITHWSRLWTRCSVDERLQEVWGTGDPCHCLREVAGSTWGTVDPCHCWWEVVRSTWGTGDPCHCWWEVAGDTWGRGDLVTVVERLQVDIAT